MRQRHLKSAADYLAEIQAMRALPQWDGAAAHRRVRAGMVRAACTNDRKAFGAIYDAAAGLEIDPASGDT